MKKQEEINYKLPIITLRKVSPTLQDEKRTYANELIGRTRFNLDLVSYETKGLDLDEFLGMEMECLFEITLGTIWYNYQEGIPKNAISAKYLWEKQPYVFFPELTTIMETPEKENLQFDDEIEEAYEKLANTIFSEWGIGGFGLGIYQHKPMLETSEGIFLLNEYAFEDDIDLWELNEEIFVEIEEIFLRGIQRYIPPFVQDEGISKKELARRNAIRKKRREGANALKEQIERLIKAKQNKSSQ